MGTCSIELVSCISKSRDLVQSHEYISVVVPDYLGPKFAKTML